jgi:formylglycine-generating enzyme required for sulfatase activity
MLWLPVRDSGTRVKTFNGIPNQGKWEMSVKRQIIRVPYTNGDTGMNKSAIRFFAMLSVTAMVSTLTATAHVQDTSGNASKEITNSIGMKLVFIRPGEFLMGSPEGEKERKERENSPQLRVLRTQPFFVWKEKEFPQHKVKITRPFYLGATEVTQRQWKSIMEKNPSGFKGDDLPVETISWVECQEFLKKLSKKEGKTYRLPTEAEWEYACRAGSTTLYFSGDDEARLEEFAWFNANSEKKTHPVAQKKPNARGLYDMHGNVCEWCQDHIGEYPKDTVTDPTGAETGERPLRGGSWSDASTKCRSAFRDCHTEGYSGAKANDHRNGFRVVGELAPSNLPNEKKP